MPAYNLDTAEAFARHARRALEEDEDASLPTLQVALYNARVSLEMTLKALLEKAGMPVG